MSNKILTPDEVATIEAHWISGASSEEEDDENIGALCTTVRHLETTLQAHRELVEAFKVTLAQVEAENERLRGLVQHMAFPRGD